MIKIEGDFLTITAKVRTNGDSFIVGLKKDDCEVASIEKGSMLQMFVRKVGEVKEVVGVAPTSEVKIPPEDIEQLVVLKAKGKTKDEIKEAIDNNNDIEYSYEDLPDKIKKEIEK